MKEFLKKPLVHYTMVLTIVSIICGALIGSVNAIKAPVIEKNRIESQNKSYK
jgi:Na+-translocating ferredoxin:NAD+ oxidoreductase RnfG subunit